jgi:hypothetical protein
MTVFGFAHRMAVATRLDVGSLHPEVKGTLIGAFADGTRTGPAAPAYWVGFEHHDSESSSVGKYQHSARQIVQGPFHAFEDRAVQVAKSCHSVVPDWHWILRSIFDGVQAPQQEGK